jgi:TRAP-type mannitol/chloroaromatic compound transport system substrate-binding protein
MERRKFLTGTSLGVAAGAGLLLAACGKKDEPAKKEAAAPATAAPAVAAGLPAIRWRLASSFPKALDTIYGAADVFAAAVKDITGGKFEISVHAGGELMPAFGVVDGVQNGTVECAHTAPYYFFGKDETFAFDCAVPFGLNSRQQTAWMYEGNGMKLMREFYSNYNIVNFPMGNTGAQMGGWYRKEIKSLADIKGMKMRIGGFGGKVLAAIGGVPQNIPAGEIYPALEKGTIDATEWVGPYDDEKLGFYKVAPFYYYPGWWEGGPQLSLYVNSKAFGALPKEYQAAINAAASLAHSTMQARYDAKNPDALKRLVGGCAKLRPMPRAIMDAAFKASNEVYADLSAKNANWKKVYEDWSAFRADQVLWFRVTEREFDNFMSAQKL